MSGNPSFTAVLFCCRWVLLSVWSRRSRGTSTQVSRNFNPEASWKYKIGTEVPWKWCSNLESILDTCPWLEDWRRSAPVSTSTALVLCSDYYARWSPGDQQAAGVDSSKPALTSCWLFRTFLLSVIIWLWLNSSGFLCDSWLSVGGRGVCNRLGHLPSRWHNPLSCTPLVSLWYITAGWRSGALK